MHSFGAEKKDFSCVDVSHDLRSNLACFPYPFRCSLSGQCWPEIELGELGEEYVDPHDQFGCMGGVRGR